MRATATILILVATCGHVVRAQSAVACVETLYSDVVNCFKGQGLSLSVQPGQQDATKLMQETQAMDPAVQCQNKEAYKTAISCSLEVLRRCLKVMNMAGAIPDPENFRKGMDAVCERVEDFDNDCFKANYQRILSCGQDTVAQVVRDSTDNPTMDDIICMSADVNYDCSKQNLQACGKNTLDIYLEQLDKYQVPPVCLDRRPGRQGRQSYVESSAVGVTATALSSALSSSFVAFVLNLVACFLFSV